MNISSACVSLVKDYEGCSLKAYKDIVGVPTIGYGHIEDVTMGDEIAQQQAEQMLADDLQDKADAVAKLITVEVTQAQFDALVSFAYNLGVGALAGSTLLKLVNRGDFDSAADQFERWNHAGGKPVFGLTRRRLAEKALFESESV